MEETAKGTNTLNKQAVQQAIKEPKQVSLADQVRMEKQIRADKCIKELGEAIEGITEKHNCRLVIQMIIGEQGATPQMNVVANDLK